MSLHLLHMQFSCNPVVPCLAVQETGETLFEIQSTDIGLLDTEGTISIFFAFFLENKRRKQCYILNAIKIILHYLLLVNNFIRRAFYKEQFSNLF